MLSLIMSLAMAKTHAVCDTGFPCFATLAEAVDAADPDDVIALSDGIHVSDGLTLNTADVTLLGYGGAVLDLSGPLVIEGDGVAVQNVALTGSSDVLLAVQGAGGVTLEALVVSGHTSAGESALVVSGDSQVTMIRPVMTGNTGVDGASLRIVDSDVTMVGGGGSISNDVAAGNGGSIWMQDATLTVTNMTLSGSQAQRGGAIYAIGGNLSLESVTIDGPSASVGGAIYGSGTEVVLSDVVVTGATATNDGGVLLAEDGSVTVRDGLFCSTGGASQLHFTGAAVDLRSITVREGVGPAVQALNGSLSVDYSTFVDNPTAVKVDGVTASVSNSLVALQAQQALVATTGDIVVNHSAFWSNGSNGDGAPGTNGFVGDPLLDYTPAVCSAIALDPSSPILGLSSDGRAMGHWQDDVPLPVDSGDTGLVNDTGGCDSTDTGRTCDDGIPGPYPDTGPFIDTGRGQPGPVDTVDTSIWVIETGSDNDTGERPPRDTGMYVSPEPPEPPIDGDSGDTLEFTAFTGDTGFNDQDRWTALTGDTGASGDTAGTPTPTGDTGLSGGSGTGGTDPTTDPPTPPTDTTPPTGTDGAGGASAQTPFFTCSTTGAAPALWWLLAVAPFALRRRR